MGRESVLVVEDDDAIAKVLGALVRQRGLEPALVASAEEAVAHLERRPVDLVLSDIRLPGMDGVALLRHVVERYPEVPVVLLTAHASVALAVEAMKLGAADFVQKPFDRDELGFALDKALASTRKARAEVPAVPATGGLLGDAAALREVLATVKKVAPSNATVLVRGETGTGKELVARAIHDASPRRDEAFVRVHCAAIPETLLESELFGHERGAFTGAVQRKPGRVELAHRGTLFLDEIGDVSATVQVKLLRLLQERELERVGGTETVRVDVRFVAATHRNLEAMVAAGTFREDLFYRLAVVPIVVPPLRDRRADIGRLAKHFAHVFDARRTFDDDAITILQAQPWPGNVRQLQNLVERLVVLADEAVIDGAAVERALGLETEPRSARAPGSLDEARRVSERASLVRALAEAGNNRTQAARLLQVSRRTLYNKLREHGI